MQMHESVKEKYYFKEQDSFLKNCVVTQKVIKTHQEREFLHRPKHQMKKKICLIFLTRSITSEK